VLNGDPGVEVPSKKGTAGLPNSSTTRTRESALRCAVNGGSIEKCSGVETNPSLGNYVVHYEPDELKNDLQRLIRSGLING